MNEVTISTDQILEFLSEWKTRREFEAEFSFSNTESYNMINWLLKAKYIVRVKGTYGLTKSTNKLFLYKRV